MNNNLIIVVDRQFASGGMEICTKLSEEFGIPLYSKAIIRDAIIEKGYNPALFDNAEEIANNSLIYSLSMGIYAKDPNISFDSSGITLGHSVNRVQSEIVEELCSKGPCIFIGCCADYILGEYPGCIKIFIKAKMDFRIKRAKEVENLGEDIGENAIRRRDRQRESYHNCFADASFGSAENYHLLIDSSLIGIDHSAEVLIGYIKRFLSQNADIVSGK